MNEPKIRKDKISDVLGTLLCLIIFLLGCWKLVELFLFVLQHIRITII